MFLVYLILDFLFDFLSLLYVGQCFFNSSFIIFSPSFSSCSFNSLLYFVHFSLKSLLKKEEIKTDLVRNPTSDEITGDPTDETSKAFEPILLPGGVIPKTPQMLFEERLGTEGSKAALKQLPFAEGAARAEYQDTLDTWKRQFRRQGYANKKKPSFDSIDWKRYSDVKNFELLKEGKTRDKGLSKEYKVSVYVQYKKYRFKGFSNTYTVMEDADNSLARTLDRLKGKEENSQVAK